MSPSFLIFTLDTSTKFAGSFLAFVALVLDVVLLMSIQFIFLCFWTLLAIVYDAAWPVSRIAIPGFISFPLSI
jgi:hypothetical protein